MYLLREKNIQKSRATKSFIPKAKIVDFERPGKAQICEFKLIDIAFVERSLELPLMI